MVSDVSALARLQAWYASCCDGDWEHAWGVRIDTCDNPGWWVRINLQGTPLQERAFQEVAEGIDADRSPLSPRWLSCRVDHDTWQGAGDESQLERILELFLDWADRGVA